MIYRNDHKFLLDQIVPKPGGTVADYDLVIASQPYRARASLEFKAKRVLAPLARALGPGGRMIAIHSYGHDPGMEIIHKVWPNDNPFTHSRHDLLKEVKHELGAAGRDLNFNAYSDQRSLFRYEMHTLPSEISSSIGTSTLLAAWNAAIYVAQIEDDRLSDVNSDRRYIEATRDVLQKHGGLWFYDEIFRDLAPARVSARERHDASPNRRFRADAFRSRRRGRTRPRSPRWPTSCRPARRSISPPCRRSSRAS